MRFGVGASQLKHLPPEEALSEAAEMGFDFFQWNPIVKGKENWGSKWESDYDFTRLERLKKKAEKQGVPLLSMHLPYLPTPSLGLDFIKESIKAAKTAGAEYMVVHPVAYGSYIDLFTQAAKLCSAVNLQLLIENPSRQEENIGISIPTVYSPLRFLRLVRQSGAGVCYDCNHAVRVGLDPIAFYAMVSKFTSMIHISDASSDLSVQHAPMGKGEVNFDKLFSLIKASRFSGLVVLELRSRYHHSLKSQLEELRRGLGR